MTNKQMTMKWQKNDKPLLTKKRWKNGNEQWTNDGRTTNNNTTTMHDGEHTTNKWLPTIKRLTNKQWTNDKQTNCGITNPWWMNYDERWMNNKPTVKEWGTNNKQTNYQQITNGRTDRRMDRCMETARAESCDQLHHNHNHLCIAKITLAAKSKN